MHLNDHSDKNISEICLYMTPTLFPKGQSHIVVIIHFSGHGEMQIAVHMCAAPRVFIFPQKYS